MRRVLTMIAGVAMAAQAFAMPPRTAGDEFPAERVPGAPWIQGAPASALSVVPLAKLDAEALAVRMADRPFALLETNYYVFTPGSKMHLRWSIDNNGYPDPVTMYMYWQNRTTGETRYYNLASGLLGEGERRDLFSQSGSPVPVLLPNLYDFVLFGTASDADGWGNDGALGQAVTVPANETGLYQWVMEIRSTDGKEVIVAANAMYSYVEELVTVPAQISTDTTWTADRAYVLAALTVIEAPAVLTIEPGTVVIGTQAGGTTTAVVANRGAKLMADGTVRAPIIFASDQKTGERKRGDWGGLVLNGSARVNDPAGERVGEGNTGLYGGTDDMSSCGSLTYVRVEFAGARITPENELNGIAFQACGAGTKAEFIQVTYNADDQLEWFGGMMNGKYFFLTGGGDDMIDWVLGARGKMQYIVAIHENVTADNGDNGFELDNWADGKDNLPRSNFMVSHVTMLGGGPTSLAGYGALLREGTAGEFYNMAMYGNKKAAAALRNQQTWNQVGAGTLKWNYNVTWDNPELKLSDLSLKAGDTFTLDDVKGLFEGGFNRQVNGMVGTARKTLDLDGDGVLDTTLFSPYGLEPLPGSPLLDINFVKPLPDDGFFDVTADFAGAVRTGRNWVATGWAMFSDN